MRGTIAFMLLWFCFSLLGQKHDYFWKTGFGNGNATYEEGVDIDFNVTPPDTSSAVRSMEFIGNSATVCDAMGNVLFSSNGCWIAGADDLPLMNGDSLNPGYYFGEFCHTSGYPTRQDIFFLPHPIDTNLYYLIHIGLGYLEWVNGTYIGGINERVYATLLDKRLDGGRGDVVEKNTIILKDTMSLSSLSAVRHGNGEDWWIITSKYASDNYIFIRLTADSIYESHRQEIGGFNQEDGATGQNNFSPDGRWFARFGRNNGLILYRFNRCEAILSEPLYDVVPTAQDSSISTGGVVFSEDSRMMYLVTNLWIYQYDLWADDIIGSKLRVATWDGNLTPPNTAPDFYYLAQLGPDGRIYIASVNTIPYLHVIEYPNKRGYACGVRQSGFKLPHKNGLLIPYFPNYRLGALSQEACDSLSTAAIEPNKEKRYELQLFPNPTAGDELKVNCVPIPKNEDVLCIFNLDGGQFLKQSATENILDIGALPSGLYILQWLREGTPLATEKLLRL